MTSVGGITVERITDVKRSGATADKNPPKGVLHTTEGSWNSSLNVFRYNTGTPTFMVGRDGSTRRGWGYDGKLRIAQFMPIGEMALTLKNGSGSPETNRDCIVQIELVAFCQWEPWLPDEATTELLKALMVKLKEVANVPLKRGGNNTRSVTNWNNNSGWFGHSEVPENDHTDPRAIKWAEILSGTPQEDDDDVAIPAWYPPWKRWYIVGRPKGVPQPNISGLPSPIPQWAWDDVEQTTEIHRALGAPVIYQNWRNARMVGAPMPENVPAPIPDWWWDSAVIDHKFANDYAEKADDPLQQKIAEQMQTIVRLQNELASTQIALAEALADDTNDSAEIAELKSKVEEAKHLLNAAIAELTFP